MPPNLKLKINAKKAVVPKSTTAFFLCRRPESNRYGRLGPQDFKSCASASSATPATTVYNAYALHNIEIIQNHVLLVNYFLFYFILKKEIK